MLSIALQVALAVPLAIAIPAPAPAPAASNAPAQTNVITALLVNEIYDGEEIIIDSLANTISTSHLPLSTSIYTTILDGTSTVPKDSSKASSSLSTSASPSNKPAASSSDQVKAASAPTKPVSTVQPIMTSFVKPAPQAIKTSPSSAGRGPGNTASGSVSPAPTDSKPSNAQSNLDSCNSAKFPDQCRAALSQHNKYRGMHSAPPMIWDNDLAAVAASKMASASCQMKDYIDPYPGGYQSNAEMGARDLAGATDHWYSELGLFNTIGGFGKSSNDVDAALAAYNRANGKSDEVGHLVNLLFKAHTKLGCVQNLDCASTGYGTNFLCLYSPYALNDEPWQTNLSPN